jgi:hypothetical protein
MVVCAEPTPDPPNTVDVTDIDASLLAKDYRSAVPCDTCDVKIALLRIHEFLRRRRMAAYISPPSKSADRIYFRVVATDRTDTEFIFVFDLGGKSLEVASIPLA